MDSYDSGRSPYGLYNMAGNVWEMTSSDYDGSGKRVIRGGSWPRSASTLLSTNRGDTLPGSSALHVGFRCTQDAS